MAKFEFYQSVKDHEFRLCFKLATAGDQITGISRDYRSEHDSPKGIEPIRSNEPGIGIV